MAELDYAFLADRAQIENGRLFVMGGSFTHVTVNELPSPFSASLAGRIRAVVGESATNIEITVEAPKSAFQLEISGILGDALNSRPYRDDRVGRLFALNFEVPLISEGLYSFIIKMDDVEVRRLAFDVELNAG